VSVLNSRDNILQRVYASRVLACQRGHVLIVSIAVSSLSSTKMDVNDDALPQQQAASGSADKR
jgi:hypothetical protein